MTARNPNSVTANVSMMVHVEEILNIDEIMEYLGENGFLADYINSSSNSLGENDG